MYTQTSQELFLLKLSIKFSGSDCSVNICSITENYNSTTFLRNVFNVLL